MDFSDPNFSLATLKSIHEARCQKFLDVQHDSDKKAEAKNLKADCDALLAEIGRRESATKPEPLPSNPIHSSDYKLMMEYFRMDLTTFNPTDDVILFVKKLERGFKIHAARDKRLEIYFCRQIASKLNDEYSDAFLAVEESSRDTLEKCKKWLLDNFSTKETIFQILDGLTELEMGETDNLQTFATRCQDKAVEVETRVSTAYKAKAKTDMTTKNVFELFASMRVYDHLRNKENDTFKMVARELDECFIPTDLSQKARVYMDRIKTPENIGTSDAAFKVAVSRKRTNDCFSFKKHGECRRGNNCRYKHDPKYAKKKRTEDSKARENVQKPDEKRMVYLSKAEHDRLIMMREENAERQVFMGNVRDSDGSNESSVFQED